MIWKLSLSILRIEEKEVINMISLKEFREGNFKKKGNRRDKHPVLLFLRKNRFQAYTVKEIVKEVKMGKDTVRSVLRRLKQDNIIEHKAPYFVLKQKIPKKPFKKTGKKLKKISKRKK